ncbi:hypothetical protein AB1Y20_002488 [Prymnesium parvum]|uniref:Uncharacterized protein n=1 Tax=Prymnesium parvum TaxID=97485 RepID=A0AB34J835_PRYPA
MLAAAGRLSLEDLAFYYGTDKAHDDHKYTDLYASLFDPIRDSVRNVTEIGVAQGQSLQEAATPSRERRVWHDYFEKAQIWGVDIHKGVINHARKLFEGHPRVHIKHANSKQPSAVSSLGLSLGSMDIIIDDGDHFPPVMEKTLHLWWPYLRVGGFYCIEDIATGANSKGQRYGGKGPFYPSGWAPLVHNDTWSRPETKELFAKHDSFFVDTMVGHRTFEAVRKALGLWMKDRVDHGSHILVIRKRLTPRTHKVDSALAKRRAMWEDGVRPMRPLLSQSN